MTDIERIEAKIAALEAAAPLDRAAAFMLQSLRKRLVRLKEESR